MSIHKQTWSLVLPHSVFQLGETICLSRDDHHYLANVLRLSKGESIEISNGIGTKAIGILAVLNKKECCFHITSVTRIKEPQTRVHLVLAQLKTAALEESIKLTSEIGVASIHVFCSEHTASKQTLKLEKLQKIAYESLRVSKSAFATIVSQHNNLHTCVAAIVKNFQNPCFVFCDEECHTPISLLSIKDTFRNLFVLIGPEASFSKQERSLIQELSNSCTVSLGSNILRAPTAAVCASFSLLSTFNLNTNGEVW